MLFYFSSNFLCNGDKKCINHYSKRGYAIDRAEAVAVLRELGQIHSEIAFAEIVTINESSNIDEFELKIKCVLDAHGRKLIDEFLQKRKLEMRVDQGFIIIRG